MNPLISLFEYVLHFISPFDIDRVGARFERVAADAAKVAANRRASAEAHMEAARDLMATAADHAAHAERADRIAARIKALVD